ncbi:MAG: GNAT family N-acetyltransferase [Gammaproteobacteria bacterium]|jgi:CelD/BcsL family acetyltransferase involved in cellulose biosynthesis
MQIDVIRNLDQLTGLHDAWNQSVAESNFDSVFVTHEWFYCWLKNFAPNQNIYIVIARDNDVLLGIMPLLLEQRRHGIWTQTILKSMTNMQTYKYNLIICKERAEEILAAMFRYLNQNLPWTSMILDFVPATAANIPLLNDISGKSFYALRSEIQMESPYLAIEGTWDDYLKARDKKVRKNWDYFERKLDKQGSAEVVSCTNGPDIDQSIQQALAIEQSSWKGDHGTAIANSQAESNFYLDLGITMSRCNKFGLHFLTLDENKIAFDYCLTHKDHFNVLKTGYDPAYSKSSPGRVLHKKILRQLYEDDTYKIYDLLGARDNWKTEWTGDVQTLLHIHIYNRRPMAIFSYTIVNLMANIKEMLRRHPSLFQAIKKLYLRFKG